MSDQAPSLQELNKHLFASLMPDTHAPKAKKAKAASEQEQAADPAQPEQAPE